MVGISRALVASTVVTLAGCVSSSLPFVVGRQQEDESSIHTRELKGEQRAGSEETARQIRLAQQRGQRDGGLDTGAP